MTVAISLKVNDGVVLAADSASTIMDYGDSGEQSIFNIYDNANKVFCFHRDLPLAGITWGVSTLGHCSIATMTKDFGALLTKSGSEWAIDPFNYTVEEVVQKFHHYVVKHFSKQLRLIAAKGQTLGFILAGYSSDAPLAEEWELRYNGETTVAPVLIRSREEVGATWNGIREAISRLYLGYGSGLATAIQSSGVVQPGDLPVLMGAIKEHCTVPFVVPAMPLQDAINLASFLVDITIKYCKYAPGAPVVGGSIEIACVTKHEGFKWAKRNNPFVNSYER